MGWHRVYVPMREELQRRFPQHKIYLEFCELNEKTVVFHLEIDGKFFQEIILPREKTYWSGNNAVYKNVLEELNPVIHWLMLRIQRKLGIIKDLAPENPPSPPEWVVSKQMHRTNPLSGDRELKWSMQV